jgi:hypothetical protein
MIECYYSPYSAIHPPIQLTMGRILIQLVIGFGQEDLCIHPLHFALENNLNFFYELVTRFDAVNEDGESFQSFDSFYGAPTSIIRKLEFGDEDKKTKLRQECHIPEEVEFDLCSYYLYVITFKFSLLVENYRPLFDILEEYCRNVGRSKTAINPVVAVMYGLLHKNSHDRCLYVLGWRTILEVAVVTCAFYIDDY